jgi:hypothetical protein
MSHLAQRINTVVFNLQIRIILQYSGCFYLHLVWINTSSQCTVLWNFKFNAIYDITSILKPHKPYDHVLYRLKYTKDMDAAFDTVQIKAGKKTVDLHLKYCL